MTKKPERQIETRTFVFDLRNEQERGDGLTLSGYAAVFNSPTRIEGWDGPFDEQIARGAFAKTIKERTPIIQWDHGHDPATGTAPIGMIETLREDQRGLYVEARLFDNARVQPVRDAIAAGAITGMSFRFQVLEESSDMSGDIELRTIRAVKLFELGPVAFPAYADTSVGVRDSVTADHAGDRAGTAADNQPGRAGHQPTRTTTHRDRLAAALILEKRK